MNQTTNVKASVFSQTRAGISVLPSPVVMGQHPPKAADVRHQLTALVRVGGGLPHSRRCRDRDARG